MGIIPVRQGIYKFIRLCELTYTHQLLICRVHITPAKILFNSAREKHIFSACGSLILRVAVVCGNKRIGNATVGEASAASVEDAEVLAACAEAVVVPPYAGDILCGELPCQRSIYACILFSVGGVALVCGAELADTTGTPLLIKVLYIRVKKPLSSVRSEACQSL